MEETGLPLGPELVSWLESEQQPLSRAIEAMERWSYIYRVASAALSGRVIDSSLPQIVADPIGYIMRAQTAVDGLWDWTLQYCAALGIPPGARPLLERVDAPPAA